MKQAMLILVMATMLFSCGGNQSKAEEMAKLIQQAANKNSPGSVPTSHYPCYKYFWHGCPAKKMQGMNITTRRQSAAELY